MHHQDDSRTSGLMNCFGGGASIHDVKIEQHVHLHIHLGGAVSKEEQVSLAGRLLKMLLPMRRQGDEVEITDPVKIGQILMLAEAQKGGKDA